MPFRSTTTSHPRTPSPTSRLFTFHFSDVLVHRADTPRPRFAFEPLSSAAPPASPPAHPEVLDAPETHSPALPKKRPRDEEPTPVRRRDHAADRRSIHLQHKLDTVLAMAAEAVEEEAGSVRAAQWLLTVHHTLRRMDRIAACSDE